MRYLIDIAEPGANNMGKTIQNKKNKYRELAEEVQRTWRTNHDLQLSLFLSFEVYEYNCHPDEGPS